VRKKFLPRVHFFGKNVLHQKKELVQIPASETQSVVCFAGRTGLKKRTSTKRMGIDNRITASEGQLVFSVVTCLAKWR
jgi:hypothetical protein